MKTLIAALAACTLFGLAAPAAANVTEDQNGWLCGAPDAWELAAFKAAPKLILNNFFFNEKNSLRTKMQVLEIKYSVINRQTKGYSMTGQFVGFDPAGAVTFAISASPDFDMANAGTSTASDDVYITQPVLARTTKICAAFAVEAKKR